MNIFFLHYNPTICAKYHVDRHVVKMILETCQLLCTAIQLTKEINDPEPPYKKTHENHPSSIWSRKSKKNWSWLKELGIALCKEYTYRYNKIHKCENIIKNLNCPNLSDDEFTEPSQAMPDEYKDKSSIIAYRLYYACGKKHLHHHKNRHAWKNRKIPKFISVIYPEYDL